MTEYTNGQQACINHMRDMFLLLVWADYSDDHDLTYPGQCFTVENMPEPAAWCVADATDTAEDLYWKIAKHWEKQVNDDQSWPHATVDPYECVRETWTRTPGEHDLDKFVEDWCHDAVMTGIGHGVSWEDDHDPIKFYTEADLDTEGPGGGIELSVSSLFPGSDDIEGWEGAYGIAPEEAENIAHQWSEGGYPVYAFASTGAVQSEQHREDLLTELRKDRRWFSEQELDEELTQQDKDRGIEQLDQLMEYIRQVPIKEV